MRITILASAACFVLIATRSVVGQSGSSKPATYITKEEVDIVNKQPGKTPPVPPSSRGKPPSLDRPRAKRPWRTADQHSSG